MEKLRPDAAVEADAARYVLHIRADLLAQVGNFVDESDLGRQKRVGGVFDQLRRPPCREQHRRLVEEQRAVQFGHHGSRARILRADDDAVGDFEIADRRTFAQEFGVGDDGEFGIWPCLTDDRFDGVAGADRYGRFVDDYRIAGQRLGDFLGGRMNIAQVGMAIAAPRRGANGDEDGLGPSDAALQIGREAQPTGTGIAGDQLFKPGFIDRHDAVVEPLDLARIEIDADHIVAEIGENTPPKPGRHSPIRSSPRA